MGRYESIEAKVRELQAEVECQRRFYGTMIMLTFLAAVVLCFSAMIIHG